MPSLDIPDEETEVFEDAQEEFAHTRGPVHPRLERVSDIQNSSPASSHSMTEVLLPGPSVFAPKQEATGVARELEEKLKVELAAGTAQYALHRVAFSGTSQDALALLKSMTTEEIVSWDPLGNTALHVAVLRRRPSMVIALLDGGFPVTAPSRGNWTALDDAVALKDKELVKILHSRQTAGLKAELKSKKELLLESLDEIPDCDFQLKWELRSPVLGILLRKYAPSDTYQVWKRGTKMRVDGSMMGLDVKRTTILPVWKRGHFSLLCDGSKTPATMLLCDHTKKKYWDLYAEKKRNKPTLDEEASLLITDGAYKTKVRASEKYFKPVKSWFGGDATEKIEGWKTKIFEASGKMMAITITKRRFDVPQKATWDEYLALSVPEDVVKEEPVDLTSMDLMQNKTPKPVGEEEPEEDKKKKQARKISGKCWMAENFPMSLKSLLPLLEVIGNANKHIAQVGNFLQKYGNKDLFPVKLQLPLFYTIYALVSFSQFKHLSESSSPDAGTDAFYELPAGYDLREFNDAPKRRRTRSASLSFDATEATRAHSLEVQGSDAEILKQMGL